MNRRAFLKAVPAVTVLGATASAMAEEAVKPAATPTEAAKPAAPSAGDLKPVDLVKPQADGGKSVLAALKERRTNRNIKDEKLPAQTLSNLLWAAWGVNRDDCHRTAASASNAQEIDLYVFLEDGVYRYDAAPHRLVPVVAGDQRAKAGRGRAATAPVNLVFVANMARYAKAQPQEPGLKDPEIRASYYNIACGLIAGNVYVFCASQGLAAWFHNCDKPGLTTLLGLGADEKVLYAQTVGVPA
jgi:nitroreductase